MLKRLPLAATGLQLLSIGLMVCVVLMLVLSGCGEKEKPKPTTPINPSSTSWTKQASDGWQAFLKSPIPAAFQADLAKWNASNKRRLTIEFGWIFTPHAEKPTRTKASPIPAPYLTEALTTLMNEALSPSLYKRIQPERHNGIYDRNPRRGETTLVTAKTVQFDAGQNDALFPENLTLAQWIRHKQQSHGLHRSLAVYQPTEAVTFGEFCQWAVVLFNLHQSSVNPQAFTVQADDTSIPLTLAQQQALQAYKTLKHANRLPALTPETELLDLLQQPMSRLDLLLLATSISQQQAKFMAAWQQANGVSPYTEDWQPTNASPLATIDKLGQWQDLSEPQQAVVAWGYYQGWLQTWFDITPEQLLEKSNPEAKPMLNPQAVLTQAEAFACLRTLTSMPN